MMLRRKANDRMRSARLRMPSPSGSGLAMSRRELADLVNAHLAAQDIGWLSMDANHIGKYERAEHIWPHREYREALRAVLGAGSDADLGFYTRRTVDVGTVARPLRPPGWAGVTVAALTTRQAGAVTSRVAGDPVEVPGA